MTMVKKDRKTYAAGEFKAKCLGVIDDVAREQQTVYITKRGKLMAQLSPPPAEVEAVRQSLEGSILFEEDVVSPIDESWDADQ